jgi:hypothetical protein
VSTKQIAGSAKSAKEIQIEESIQQSAVSNQKQAINKTQPLAVSC